MCKGHQLGSDYLLLHQCRLGGKAMDVKVLLEGLYFLHAELPFNYLNSIQGIFKRPHAYLQSHFTKL